MCCLWAAYGLDLKKQSQTLIGGYSYFNPSRLFLYYNTREYEGTTQQDSGASIRDTVKALNRKGVCKEEDWPYNVWRFKTKPPQRCYDAAQGNNLCKYERLRQDVDQLRACLNDNCPFIFGFHIYGDFSGTQSQYNGGMSMHKYEGSHAVVAVGYNDDKKYFIV